MQQLARQFFAQHSYCRTDPSRVDHMERRCTDAFFETLIKMRARKTNYLLATSPRLMSGVLLFL